MDKHSVLLQTQNQNPGRYQARVDATQPESPGIVVISMDIRKRDLERDFLSLCIGRFLGLARGKCRRRRHFALFWGPRYDVIDEILRRTFSKVTCLGDFE